MTFTFTITSHDLAVASCVLCAIWMVVGILTWDDSAIRRFKAAIEADAAERYYRNSGGGA